MNAPVGAQAAPVGASTEQLPAIAAPATSRALTLDLSVQDLLRQKRAIAELVKEVLIEDTHYGASFPGDTKKNLLQPGADALMVLFGLVPRFAHTREDVAIAGEGMHREYTITCTLFTRSGIEVGSGIGSCSTMEGKYRWRNDKRKCPACGQPSIIKVNKGRNPGSYWCVPDKGGCGANFDKGDEAVESQVVGKVPNPDIADTYNTVLKIATKRAKVAATIACTGCSDMFHQDLEDLDASIAAGDEASAPNRGGAAPGARAAATAPPPAAAKAAAAAQPLTTAAPDIDAQITAEYGTLQVRAGKGVALKIWNHWKKAEQKPDRLTAMKKANAAIKTITERLGQKSEQLLNDIMVDRSNPDDVAGIIADLDQAASAPPATAVAPPAAADTDQPPF